jgi:hypothetical protein
MVSICWFTVDYSQNYSKLLRHKSSTRGLTSTQRSQHKNQIFGSQSWKSVRNLKMDNYQFEILKIVPAIILEKIHFIRVTEKNLFQRGRIDFSFKFEQEVKCFISEGLETGFDEF